MNTFTADSLEQAWVTIGLSVLDMTGDVMYTSLTFWPTFPDGWTARVEIPKPRVGRGQLYWRFYGEGETPALALFACAERVRREPLP